MADVMFRLNCIRLARPSPPPALCTSIAHYCIWLLCLFFSFLFLFFAMRRENIRIGGTRDKTHATPSFLFKVLSFKRCHQVENSTPQKPPAPVSLIKLGSWDSSQQIGNWRLNTALITSFQVPTQRHLKNSISFCSFFFWFESSKYCPTRYQWLLNPNTFFKW